MKPTKMKIEYCKQIDSDAAPWQPLTNIDELIWNGVFTLRVTDDNGSHGLPFHFANDDIVTLVVKDHTPNASLPHTRTTLQEVTRVDRTTGKAFTYTRTRYNDGGEHTWSGWIVDGGNEIPIATKTTLGGVIIGDGLSINTEGKVSVDGRYFEGNNFDKVNFAIYTNALNSQSGGNIFDKNAVGILVNKIFKDIYGNIEDREKYNISDYMAVVPGETYIISNEGTKPYGYSADKEHVGMITATSGVFTVPEGVYWIRISYYQGWADTFCINKGTIILPVEERTFGLVRTEKLYNNAVTSEKIADNAVTMAKLDDELKERVHSLPTIVKKNGAFVVEGTLSSGEKFELPQNSISVGEYITFSANINGEFGTLYIGHGRTNGAYMKITPTTVTTYSHVTNPVSEKVFEHGLTIENNIQVYIEKSINTTTKLKIASNGKNYEFFFSSWYGNQGTPFVESEGCELKDCRFAWTCKAINSDIWAFGDSYFGVTGTIRWMAYMIAEEHTNLVVNGYGGQGSTVAYTDLTNLLTIGTPKKILWCLGMNDADSSTAVNVNWLNTYNSLKALCENNNIELVLATIPTVPTRINKFKNEIIRSSGYRYIDFDKAVGADESTGAWFSDMLSSDGVHPSETGALTLYNRAITDMPELLNC